MNSDDFKRKTTQALQRTSLAQRCDEVKKIIGESSIKELHGFFPELLGSIFGYDNRSDWGLKAPLQKSGVSDRLRVFLGTSGPIFDLINKLQVDGHLKYEFFIKCLPLPTQNSLSEGNVPLLYHNKIQISTTVNSNSSRVVLLNAFEYYMFHFAYYVIYQQNTRVTQDSNWMNDATSVYLAILEDYLNHFLPTSTLYQSTTVSSPCPPNRQQTSWLGAFRGVPQNQPQFTGLIRSNPSGNTHLAMQGHSAYDHSTGDIWRSETFIQILTEFWLNQNTMDSVTRNVLSHGQPFPKRPNNYERFTITLELNRLPSNAKYKPQNQSLGGLISLESVVYFMPSVDLVRTVRMLIKQIHTFVYSAGIEALNHPAISPLDELKRNIISQMLQKKFYCFLRHGFAHWPLDPSFRIIVETWLSFIQPWRYANNTTTQSKNETSVVFNGEWSSFVHENFPFYSVIAQEFVLRALKLDLYSSKDLFVLLRFTKVLAQGGLMDVIDEGEKLLSESPKGALRGTPPGMGVSAGSALRAIYLNLEGPSYTYLLNEKLERLLCNVSSALTSIKRPHQGISGQSSQAGGQGSISWLKSIFSGEFLDDDYYVNRDTDKVVSYLEQSYRNLTTITKVNCDVTDAGDQTIPWATPSAAHERRSPSITSSTISQGSIPECIQTDRGLILTERGKYQMINGLRQFEVHYSGDPELQPIRSYENPTLVRLLYRLSSHLNAEIGDRLHDLYSTPGYLGSVACTLSPCLKTPSHNTQRASPTTTQRSHMVDNNPRISLRFLASYKTMFYFVLLYLLCKILSLGSLTILALFILVLFFSMLANVCPDYTRNEEVQKKLF